MTENKGLKDGHTWATSTLVNLIEALGYDDAPTRVERARGEFISVLIGIGPDETAELILSKDALELLRNSHYDNMKI